MTFSVADRVMLRSLGLTSIALATLAACVPPVIPGPTIPEPTVIGEPTPGSFHIRANPPTAREPLTIRLDDGTPSRWSEEVQAGAPVWVYFTTLPEEGLALWVNGATCDGRFDVRALVETDLLLTVTDSGCQIQVLDWHAEGAVQHQLPPAIPASAMPSAK